MKNLNFMIAIVISLAFAALGDMNANDPGKGWILGIILSSVTLVATIAIGMVHSKFLKEEGMLLFVSFGILYLAVIIAPIFILKGWYGVFASFCLVILWKIIYNFYNEV